MLLPGWSGMGVAVTSTMELYGSFAQPVDVDPRAFEEDPRSIAAALVESDRALSLWDGGNCPLAGGRGFGRPLTRVRKTPGGGVLKSQKNREEKLIPNNLMGWGKTDLRVKQTKPTKLTQSHWRTAYGPWRIPPEWDGVRKI